jgi:putative transposase
MARPLRIEFPGAVYHVTCRGNAKNDIFLDDSDRHVFLSILGETVGRFGWLCYAYCLMSNHYHLLFETPMGNISDGMQYLNGVYTQRFHDFHETTGHVFQGRYKSVLVEKESYLLDLSRYVVLNPVRAGLVSSPELYRWSSYTATLGMTPCPDFLSSDWLLGQFGQERSDACDNYERFVMDGVSAGSPWGKVGGGSLLGGRGFGRKIRAMLDADNPLKARPRAEMIADRPELNEILARVKRPVDEEGVLEAHVKYGYNLTEIARFLGVHCSTVSRALNRAQRRAEHPSGDADTGTTQPTLF